MKDATNNIRYRISTLSTENKIMLISIAASVVTGIVGGVVKAVRTHKAHRRERLIYDRSNGFYIEPKHKLSTSEAIEFDDRRRNGESAIHILRDMNNVKNISK